MRIIWYVFIFTMTVTQQVLADCRSEPGVNCVDLCRADPGNRLNSTNRSETEISRSYGGICQMNDGPDRVQGRSVTIQYKIATYSICSGKWFESVITRHGCAVW